MTPPLAAPAPAAALRLFAALEGERERLALMAAVFVAASAGLLTGAWATAAVWLAVSLGLEHLCAATARMTEGAAAGRFSWRRAELMLAGAGGLAALGQAGILPLFWFFGGEAGRLFAVVFAAAAVLQAALAAADTALVRLARTAPLLAMGALLLILAPPAGALGAGGPLAVGCAMLLFLQQVASALALADRSRVAEDAALAAAAASAREAGAARAMTAALRAMTAPAPETGLLPFAPAALAAEIEALWAPVAQARGGRMRVALDPRLPAQVTGEPHRIRQIVGAMLAAAIDSLEGAGGEVTVEVTSDGAQRLAWRVRGGPGLGALSARTPGWLASQDMARALAGELTLAQAEAAPALLLETPARAA